MPESDAEPIHTAVVLLTRFRPGALGWGIGQLVLGIRPRERLAGLIFHKVLGCGRNGGFGIVPGFDRQGLFCLFSSRAAADDFIDTTAWAASYRAHGIEHLALSLQACSSRGLWSGHPIEARAPVPDDGPIASLTRASIRPRKAIDFWSRSPAAEADLAQAHGCQLAIGLGEAPLLRQATFSLWRSSADLEAYAHSAGHLAAIRAAYGRHHFSESMFVRFRPLRIEGRWQGREMMHRADA